MLDGILVMALSATGLAPIMTIRRISGASLPAS